MINPTSLPGVHIQNHAQLFLRSNRLRYRHSASDTGACGHKHAAIVGHIRSRRKKASSVVSHSSVVVGHVNKIVMHKLQTTVDAWVGYGSKRQMAWQEVWLYSAQVMFLLLIGWFECRLAGA